MQPSLAAASPFDLGFDRQRANGLVTLSPSPTLSVKAGYFNEQRRGFRGGIGTSFGFSNAVETPEDTQSPHPGRRRGTPSSPESGAWPGPACTATGSAAPFPPSPSTTPSWPPTAVGSSLLLGPARGLLSPPRQRRDRGLGRNDPEVPGRRRVSSADVSHSTWNQDQTPFIAYSTNTAITTPVVATDLAALPAPAARGQDQRDLLQRRVLGPSRGQAEVQRALPALRPRQRHARGSPSRVTCPSTGAGRPLRGSACPTATRTAASTPPWATTFGAFSIEGGYKYNSIDPRSSGRPRRRPKTGSAWPPTCARTGSCSTAATEFGSRDFSGLEIERSEDASFVNPGEPANIYARPFSERVRGGAGLQPPLRPGPAPRQQGLRPRPAHARGTLVLSTSPTSTTSRTSRTRPSASSSPATPRSRRRPTTRPARSGASTASTPGKATAISCTAARRGPPSP